MIDLLIRGDAILLYFFHLYDELTLNDYHGVELADDAAAVAHGFKIARFTANKAAKGKLDLQHRYEIVDEHGRQVRTISFADAFRTKSV